MGIQTSFHPDPRAQRVLELIREKEIVQSVDRLRLIHAPEPKRVIILCGIPLDITVDELRTLDELAGTPGRLGCRGRLEQVFKTTGFLPLGGRDLYQANVGRRSNLFQSESSARDALKRLRRSVRNGTGDNGGQHQIRYIFGIVPHYRVAKYRRAGQRGKASYVLYDARRHADPCEALSQLLLELVVLFEDVPADDEGNAPLALFGKKE